MISVFTLVLVLLHPDGSTSLKAVPMHSIEECKAAETYARHITDLSFGVIDIGSICLKSDFDPAVKPQA